MMLRRKRRALDESRSATLALAVSCCDAATARNHEMTPCPRASSRAVLKGRRPTRRVHVSRPVADAIPPTTTLCLDQAVWPNTACPKQPNRHQACDSAPLLAKASQMLQDRPCHMLGRPPLEMRPRSAHPLADHLHRTPKKTPQEYTTERDKLRLRRGFVRNHTATDTP